jgi:hypothetical protein
MIPNDHVSGTIPVSSMIQNIKTRVKHGNELSEYFISQTGLNQGEN